MQIEEKDFEVHEELYIKQIDLLSEVDEADTCFKSYIMSESLTVTLEENKSIISDGTTGLCTWQGAFMLAEWCCHNKNKIHKKHVLELGSGAGFLGIVASLGCSPSSFTFTDIHPLVLHRLKNNIHLNISQYHQQRCVCLTSSHQESDTPILKSQLPTFTDNDDVSMKYVNQCQQSCKLLPDITIRKLDWNENSVDQVTQLDVILASDVIYDPELIVPFVDVLKRLLSVSSSTVAYVAATERNPETQKLFLQQVAMKEIHHQPVKIATRFSFYHNPLPIKLWKLQIK